MTAVLKTASVLIALRSSNLLVSVNQKFGIAQAWLAKWVASVEVYFNGCQDSERNVQ